MAAPMIFRNGVMLHLVCLIINALANEDSFAEELYIKPLDTGHVLTHFQFTTRWDVDVENQNSFEHYHIFPKSLGEILSKYYVQELHLSLTQGLWRHKTWSYPFRDSPPGAELWVWFLPQTKNIDNVWSELNSVLSGQFCASLNFMDATTTTVPKWSFRPQGSTSRHYARLDRHVRYSALPREAVCTENLTPWKKLLPCSSKAGLAVLLNAIKLYDASYHSLQLDVRPVCKHTDCKESVLELSQSVTVVLDPRLKGQVRRDWSFRDLFGRFPTNVCPLASRSKVYLDITKAKTNQGFRLVHPSTSNYTVTRGDAERSIAEYDLAEILQKERLVNVAVQYKQNIPDTSVQSPMLHTHRYATGYGEKKGGIKCLLYNNHASISLTIVYMDSVPWYLRVMSHTLKIRNKNKDIKPSQFHYIPGKDRKQPYHIELVVTLPPNSMTSISYEFERALLKWTEYPPDANHGFYVSSGVVSVVLPSAGNYLSPPLYSSTIAASLTNETNHAYFLRIHTEALLITLPTPDFSMPYNVICLACTVLAISFGSVHNLTTRTFQIVDPNKQSGLFTKVKKFFRHEKQKES